MKKLKKQLGDMVSPSNNPDLGCNPCKEETTQKFGHIVVQNLAELYRFPCKLRVPGMSATVVEEGYAEFQLKATSESKCNNNNWQVAEGGGLWKYIPIPEVEEVEADPYGKEKYAMKTLGMFAETAGLFYTTDYIENLLSKIDFESYTPEQAGLRTYYDDYVDGQYVSVYADEGYYFVIDLDNDTGYKTKKFSEQSGIDIIKDMFLDKILRNYNSAMLALPYLKEVDTSVSTPEDLCDYMFKIIELSIVLPNLFSNEQLFLRSDYAPFANFFEGLYNEQLSPEDALTYAGLPQSLKDWDSIFLGYYNNQEIPFMDRIYMCFAIMFSGGITDDYLYYEEDLYTAVGGMLYQELVEGLTFEELELVGIEVTEETLQGIVLEDLDINTTQGFLDYCFVFSMAYRLLMGYYIENDPDMLDIEIEMSLNFFPDNRYNYIPEPDGDFIENIQGKSARMKEGYRITHARDLITKEYYQKNMPEIPEGNLIIATTYDDYWDYIDSGKAKVGQIVYNLEENQYFTIVDYGNGYLEYKQFSPSLEYTMQADVEIGGISAGQYLQEGMTFTEFVSALVQKVFYPTYTSPTFTVSNNAGTREVGETFNMIITVAFNRGRINGETFNGVWNPNYLQNNRAGSVTSYTINGVQQSATTRTISTTATATAQIFNASVSFSSGPTPYDSKGNSLYDQRYPAGTMSDTTSTQVITEDSLGQ